jgi:hypothetical protein
MIPRPGAADKGQLWHTLIARPSEGSMLLIWRVLRCPSHSGSLPRRLARNLLRAPDPLHRMLEAS